MSTNLLISIGIIAVFLALWAVVGIVYCRIRNKAEIQRMAEAEKAKDEEKSCNALATKAALHSRYSGYNKSRI